MANKQEKWMIYAVQILQAVNDAIQSDEIVIESNDDLTQFLHAFGNVAPTTFMNSQTDQQANYIDFNHMANKMVFQWNTGSTSGE